MMNNTEEKYNRLLEIAKETLSGKGKPCFECKVREAESILAGCNKIDKRMLKLRILQAKEAEEGKKSMIDVAALAMSAVSLLISALTMVFTLIDIEREECMGLLVIALLALIIALLCLFINYRTDKQHQKLQFLLSLWER